MHSPAKLKTLNLLPAVCLLALVPAGALAETITINCEKEDIFVQAWSGPITVTYEGGETGTISVKSSTFELQLPAAMERQVMDLAGTPGEVTRIRGSGNAETMMPDLAALEACVAAKLEPGQEGDRDLYAFHSLPCLSQTAPGAAPITVTAHVSAGIFPGEGEDAMAPIVEINRIYLEASRAPGGTTQLDNFPVNCTLAGG